MPGNNAPGDGSAGNGSAGNGAAGLTGITPSRDVLPDLTKLDKLPPGLKAAKAPAPAGLVPAKAPAPSAAAAKAAKTAAEKTAPPKAVREKAVRQEPARSKSAEPDDSDDEIPQWAVKALEELLAVTYWLDPGEEGDPFTATISFSGQRADVTGKPGSRDTFFQQETVEGIVPGSGPVAITAEVRGINPGEWTVSARPAKRAGGSQLQSSSGPGRVPWPRLIPVPADSTRRLKTSTLLFAKVPGVIRFAYPILVCLGALAGLGIVTLLLSHSHYGVLTPLLYSLAAIGAGVIGGKSWYIAVHHGRKMDGWCIQGFVAGAAVVVGAAAIAGPGVPAGVYLAAAAPALLIGMGIGRPACFWAGCCTGRPTAARWGVWSSDRRLGCRRAPAQLFEAATAFAIGLVLLVVVLLNGLSQSGPVGVAGLAAYTLVRQLILGLRAEPRAWRYGRPVTATIAAIALIASVIVLALLSPVMDSPGREGPPQPGDAKLAYARRGAGIAAHPSRQSPPTARMRSRHHRPSHRDRLQRIGPSARSLIVPMVPSGRCDPDSMDPSARWVGVRGAGVLPRSSRYSRADCSSACAAARTSASSGRAVWAPSARVDSAAAVTASRTAAARSKPTDR